MLNPNELIDAIPRITPQWLAGFFDGEGCVCATKRGSMWTVQIIIAQSDPVILGVIMMKFPKSGTISSGFGFSKKKPCFRVVWSGRYGKDLLEYIKDYVIIKRIQVEAALEMIDIISKRSSNGQGPEQTPEEANRRKELAEIICSEKK